jgi:hypothetical protein
MKLPSRGDTVHVVLAGLTEIPARVDLLDERRMSLVMPVDPDRRFKPGKPRAAQVVFASPRGVHQLNGRVIRDPVRAEILWFEPANHAIVQRRDLARVDACLAVRVMVIDDDGGRIARTTTVNVSGGGLLMQDPLGLEIGEKVQVKVELDPLAEPICAKAEVVREGPDDTKGLRLLEVEGADQERLVRYVLHRQRLELRVARGRA